MDGNRTSTPIINLKEFIHTSLKLFQIGKMLLWLRTNPINSILGINNFMRLIILQLNLQNSK
jgi:hypothetical protein